MSEQPKVDRIQRPKPVSEQMLERIRTDIIENKFKLGEKISEKQLSELYGVTKAPIRAAYIRLQSEGLLVIRPQSGTFVFKPTMDELQAFCELRRALELEAMSLAMTRNLEALKKEFNEILTKMEYCQEIDDQDTYQNLDTLLHLMIVEKANSPVLAETYYKKVNSRFAAIRHRFSQEKRYNENSMAEHRALFDSISRGDQAQTLHLLRLHIDFHQDYFAELLST